MPFGHQILIPGGVFLGVGGACRGAFTPDVRPSHTEDGSGHVGNRCSECIFGEKAPTDIEDVAIALALIARTDALEANIGAQPVQAQQEPFLNHRPIQVLSQGLRVEAIGKAHPQVRFLENIEQFDHGPARSQFAFEQP
jgi:hypothetical protein